MATDFRGGCAYLLVRALRSALCFRMPYSFASSRCWRFKQPVSRRPAAARSRSSCDRCAGSGRGCGSFTAPDWAGCRCVPFSSPVGYAGVMTFVAKFPLDPRSRWAIFEERYGKLQGPRRLPVLQRPPHGPDGRATTVRYVLPRHKAANWVGAHTGDLQKRRYTNGRGREPMASSNSRRLSSV